MPFCKRQPQSFDPTLLLRHAAAVMRRPIVHGGCIVLLVLGILVTCRQFNDLSSSSVIRAKQAERAAPTLLIKNDVPCWTNATASRVPESSCRKNMIDALSRVWQTRGRSFCDNTGSDDTLTLIKVPKSASSTLAGVLLRLESITHCGVDWKHGNAREKKRANWNIAPVRHPDARALSSVYYHEISFHQRHNENPSPSMSFLKQHLLRITENYVFDYIRWDNHDQDGLRNSLVASLQMILNTYDMLLVVDRLEESIVVLSIILQLPVNYFLTNNAKQAGSWYHVRENQCIRLHSATASIRQSVSEQVFRSLEWQRRHSIDRVLYEIANVSLTRTIDYYRTEFDQRYAEYQSYKRRIEAICASQDVFPCSFNGTSQLAVSTQHCYLRDFGCGYPCIDRITGT